MIITAGRSSGSPAFPGTFPSAGGGQWYGVYPEKQLQDYSYGDSSGFAPDSLLIHPEVEPIVDANVRQVLLKSKMLYFC
jgi:hypothetical protein